MQTMQNYPKYKKLLSADHLFTRFRVFDFAPDANLNVMCSPSSNQGPYVMCVNHYTMKPQTLCKIQPAVISIIIQQKIRL